MEAYETDEEVAAFAADAAVRALASASAPSARSRLGRRRPGVSVWSRHCR
jgi:hypothetical protein